MLEIMYEEEYLLRVLCPSTASVVQREDLQNKQYTAGVATFDTVSKKAENKCIAKEKDSILKDHITLHQVTGHSIVRALCQTNMCQIQQRFYPIDNNADAPVPVSASLARAADSPCFSRSLSSAARAVRKRSTVFPSAKRVTISAAWALSWLKSTWAA